MRLRRTVIVPVMLSLALVDRAEPQAAPWVLVGTTGDTTYYIDSARVATPRDDIVQIWTKAEFSRMIPVRDGDSYSARHVRYRIDCAKAIWRTSETVYYRGSTLVRRTSSSGRAISHSPIWPQERELLLLACKMAKERRNLTSGR